MSDKDEPLETQQWPALPKATDYPSEYRDMLDEIDTLKETIAAQQARITRDVGLVNEYIKEYLSTDGIGPSPISLNIVRNDPISSTLALTTAKKEAQREILEEVLAFLKDARISRNTCIHIRRVHSMLADLDKQP